MFNVLVLIQNLNANVEIVVNLYFLKLIYIALSAA